MTQPGTYRLKSSKTALQAQEDEMEATYCGFSSPSGDGTEGTVVGQCRDAIVPFLSPGLGTLDFCTVFLAIPAKTV